jgi:glycosyltransferase involved in cell wall biosynthesis
MVEPAHVGSLELGEEPRISRTLKQHVPGTLYELMELGYSVPEYLRLAAACKAHRPDVLYQRANLYMVSGILCARRFGLPYFVEVNAPLAEERGKFSNLRLPWLASRLEHALWRSADGVLPVTEVLARTVEGAGVPRERIHVIPNGVDLERFAPGEEAQLRKRLGLEGKLVLGFVGFVREWHHADAIIDMMAGPDLPANSHFLIVGDGPVKDALEAQARRLGVSERLIITGIVPREEVAHYVRCFDVALQPHVVAYASPLKLLEYMALGRAIVAPTTDNIRELLADGVNALLVEPANGRAYAAAVGRLACDASLRQTLGAAARDTVLSRDLTWQRNAKTVAALARAALDRRRAR